MASIFAISCWKIQENAELGPFAYGGGWGALWPLLQTADLKWSGKSGCNFFCRPESGHRDSGSLGFQICSALLSPTLSREVLGWVSELQRSFLL